MGTLMEMEMVKKVRPIHDNLIEVYTSKGLYISKSVIITCGAWTNRILRPLEIQLPLEVRDFSKDLSNIPSIRSSLSCSSSI